MLPGFRFLFAAIMLSMSLLIFGLGAAALFRAAHESFASNSPWRATPDVPFAQRPETMLPTLATLRVEPVTDSANDATRVAAAPAEPTSSPAEPTMKDQVAALKAVDTPLVDATKPESAVTDMLGTQNTPAPEAAPVAAAPETSSAANETKMAATPEASSGSSTPEPVTTSAIPATADPTTATPAATVPAMPAESIVAAKIATLGGPPVDIAPEPPIKDKTAAKSEQAKDDQSAVTKRVHARRAAHRRRLAARARLAAQQLLLQQQANPFAQPATPAVATRQRQPQ
jgi:hypothetical protein